jgi:F420-dependent oxidoreductase-like protein
MSQPPPPARVIERERLTAGHAEHGADAGLLQQLDETVSDGVGVHGTTSRVGNENQQLTLYGLFCTVESTMDAEVVAMRLGLHLGYWGSTPGDPVALAQEAERLGYESVWTAEAYGSDAVTPLTWVAARTSRIAVGTAIMQMSARTPAATAMTTATVNLLTAGRFRLGLGLSGPQVVEGWHGAPYRQPLARTREYVSIVRAALAREAPLTHDGPHYPIPYRGDDATGLGKPLRLILHPYRPDVPIYLAAIGPRNVALAAEIADGWLPLFFSPEHFAVTAGQELRAGRSLEGFDLAPTATVVVNDDLRRARDAVKPGLALYIGGMGAQGRNFYNDLARRYGYDEAADRIQEHYLAGRKDAAAAAVPDSLVDQVALVGPAARIAERLHAWRDAGVGTLILATSSVADLRTLAELVL